jgi:type IV pilus biogenesis protein CpaD/CtpE
VSSLRIVLLPLVCLMLSACTQYQNRYLEREDTVTSSAGDAVASNAAVQIPTPWPRYSNDTTIAMDGERIARAVDRYRVGEKQPVVTIPDDRLYGSTFGSANAGSPGFAGAPGAAAGEAAGPPAQGAAPAPGPQGY